MDDLELLIDLHKDQHRQGPGSDASTDLALALGGVDSKASLKVVDIGCGTGASTLRLAQQLNAQITAVDFLPEFLEKLEARAGQLGLSEKITTLCNSMENLPFQDQEYDILWSEGAVYNMGFEKGIREWRRFLKPGGLLAVSEITWTSGSRPDDIQAYWESQYAEIDTASAKLAVLEQNGFAPVGYFVLPQSCWLDNYYVPLQNSFDEFLQRHAGNWQATAIVDQEKQEIETYRQYGAYYSYGMYLCRKF